MAYPIQAGIHISLDGGTWYKLTDHNRSDIQITPELIEKSGRMANGTMRKYVVDIKTKISLSWERVPSQTTYTVDNNYSSEWLEAFYYANAGLPIYLKVVSAGETVPSMGNVPSEQSRSSALSNSKVYSAFITDFSKTIVWRTKDRDFVNMSIEFTEI